MWKDVATSHTLTAVSNVNGGSVFLLQHIPASIFGSIISIADIASNKPNISLCMSSPSDSSMCIQTHYLVIGMVQLFYLEPLRKILL